MQNDTGVIRGAGSTLAGCSQCLAALIRIAPLVVFAIAAVATFAHTGWPSRLEAAVAPLVIAWIGARLLSSVASAAVEPRYTAVARQAGKEVWTIKERFPVWGGTMTTAGGLVFYGNMEGWFKAVDAKTGEVLWQFKTSSGIIGQPTTYRGPDGKQYVAVLSGVGGWAGSIVSGDLDPRDSTAALGFVNAMADLKQATTNGGNLYVFALP